MLQKNLQRVTDWYTENVPRIVKYGLQKPVSDYQISKLQKLVGKELPQDFIALYKTYNGININKNLENFFFGLKFNSIARVIDIRKSLIDYLPTIQNTYDLTVHYCDERIDDSNIHNPDWLEIGNDNSRCTLLLDLSPSASGTYGQIIFRDFESDICIWVADSISELVSIFADDLEKGLYIPCIEGFTHFLETEREASIINWDRTERWKPYVELRNSKMNK
ncbi:SMI1/KNR4 family protein [Flectobacillus roseus]|uniref:SMI1/KNR4 family protein n=1 Tax=Flectobacillus roseus TaxID=502259 RepID=A0ABT6Y377_9BACT|nr:SMI1/KNR4 family protein [Flectobacillus roseus]MDI9858020.1 SMI1/KNR4 family protein [Flectobacillus roseus]